MARCQSRASCTGVAEAWERGGWVSPLPLAPPLASRVRGCWDSPGSARPAGLRRAAAPSWLCSGRAAQLRVALCLLPVEKGDIGALPHRNASPRLTGTPLDVQPGEQWAAAALTRLTPRICPQGLLLSNSQGARAAPPQCSRCCLYPKPSFHCPQLYKRILKKRGPPPA